MRQNYGVTRCTSIRLEYLQTGLNQLNTERCFPSRWANTNGRESYFSNGHIWKSRQFKAKATSNRSIVTAQILYGDSTMTKVSLSCVLLIWEQFNQHAYAKLLSTQMLWRSTSNSPTKLWATLPPVRSARSYTQLLQWMLYISASKISKNLLAQKLLIERCCNWHLLPISPTFYSQLLHQSLSADA